MYKKIAFIGSMGSGKTTIIGSLSNCSPLSTEVQSSIDIGKNMTTIGIDFGQINLDDETHLGLYGVPGQRKFSLVWDFVKQGLWAVVILIKNNDQDLVDELNYLIDYFEINKNTPCVIGVTHTDLCGKKKTFSQIKDQLKIRGLGIPVFSTDARDPVSAALLLETVVAIDENRNQ